MRTIKFGNAEFNLACDVVADAVNLRATILKEDNDMAAVAASVSNINDIEVIEDGELVKEYKGYLNLVGLNLYKDYPTAEDPSGKATVISIELANFDLQAQIDALLHG